MSLSAYRVFETKVAQTKNPKNRYWNLNARLACAQAALPVPGGRCTMCATPAQPAKRFPNADYRLQLASTLRRGQPRE
jgi:hypothetical protein